MKHILRLAVFVCIVSLLAVPTLAQDEPVQIPVWIAFTDGRLDWSREKAAIFNEQFPQYEVVVEGYANYEELFTATTLAAEQGSLPAVVQYFEVATQNARDAVNPSNSEPLFKSIASAVGDRTEINGIPVAFDDFIQPVAAYYTLDGEFTSMPWNTSSAIMFSNMNILEAAGVEAIPATWDEVEAACELIMALEDAPEFCFTWPNHGWFFEQWMAHQDQAIANNDNGRTARATEVTLNTDAGVALLTWLDDMVAKGYLYYSGAQGGDSWGTVDQSFLAGATAMAMYSSSDTAIYTNTGAENGFEVVASFMPYNDDTGWTGSLIGGASLWLVNGLAPEVEEGALTFLAWFTNTENAAEWHQVTGYMPIRTSSVEMLTEDGWFAENPNFLVAADQIAQSTITPATQGALMGDFPAIRNVITQAIDTVLLTDRDAAEVLAEAEAQANTILEEYNLLNAPEAE
jgi:sn-glycerol 3-phosphate transport system substrate-binding protein